MFGGPGKMGRGGGGGGAVKRSNHAPPIGRAVRPSMGSGPRSRAGAPPAAISSPSASSMEVEESFSLVRENPLNFGMAIKLAPNLVEEIKRVEAQGGGARIKFDVNANNPNGNVIHVGDKIFRFTWSSEPGDLCDIYEERQSGEDGNGLLVESGGTWRKLNVERELDESTKNEVKRRSEEAERKHKSRKAIVLDHQNPSMKNQVKALAAAENFKNRKEPPFKKAKLDPPIGGPSKSAYKASVPPATLSKGKISSGSPLSSQPEQHGGPASPAVSGNLVKGRVDINDVAPTKNTNIISSSEKEMPSKLPHNIIRDKSKHSRNMEAKPADLKSLVISLLQENQSKGMSLKALEKAIGEVMPNSARQIDPILKQVAVFQSPGRYLLKQGLEKESMKKPPSQSGSNPASNHHQPPSPEKPNQLPPRTSDNHEQEHGELNSITSPRTTDHPTDRTNAHQSPPEQQHSDSKAPAGNSSTDDSGSSSDSDSSGSSSPSHSRSDTDSDDASVSSKQASDEEVDIMSDEEPPRPELPAGPHLEDNRDARAPPLDDDDCASHKWFRSGNLSQPVSGTINSIFGDSPENSSPDRPDQSPEKRPVDVMVDIINMDDDDYDNDDDPSRGSLEARALSEKRPGEFLPVQKGLNTEEDGLVGERRPVRFSSEGIAGNKSSMLPVEDHRKLDTSGWGKENVTSTEDRLPMANGRGSVLRREYSDLELGEFREPMEDATTPLPKKQIERRNSFKQMENKPMESECRNSDQGRLKAPNRKINVDSVVKSPQRNLEPVVSGSADGPSNKRKALEKNADDHIRLHKKSSRPVEQQQMEPGPQHVRILETGNKSRFADAGPGRARSLEGHLDVSRRMSVDSTEQQQHDPVRGVGPATTKVSKKQKSTNVVGNLNGRRVDNSLAGTNDTGQKKKEFSPDEDNLYAKYEKEEPELKGPIKDASQYNDYVKEYQEKYESYRHLNKILEDYRDEFTKYGKDLETCKDRDMKRYHDTLKQMRSSFHQCGEKHKRQKKIFTVLHEELKQLKQMIKDFAASY
ncbi:dentin sialophosphoprotein-related [Striga hermonthica]|uniref:Dentin sialophosphoprotein-related n=1 Tax=Striga hermonthica TaxID=68872 RepID=A0A9N7R6K9_STRHE|nr:dentin sialophosphoprotein-related [Striga hermonthica]